MVQNDNQIMTKRRRVFLQPTPKACNECRRLKMKCEARRPCARCIIKGLSSECCDTPCASNGPRGQVHRACMLCKKAKNGWHDQCVEFGTTMFLFDQTSPAEDVSLGCLAVEECQDVERPIVYKANAILFQSHFDPCPLTATATIGYATLLERVFLKLPTFTQYVIGTGLSAFLTLQLAESNAQRNFNNTLQNDYSGVDVVEQIENEMWNQSTDTAVLRMRWSHDEETMQPVREELFANDLVSVVGIHKEEFVSRFAAHNVGIFMTELEWMCFILDEAFNAKETFVTRYWRCKNSWRTDNFDGCLWRFIVCKQFDGFGRLRYTRHFMQPVTFSLAARVLM
ncbi:hypothetical protein GUITHDRAFT_121971 [Guillardia theta CCMP2712]|uniref:Zn(2)-C6 fungal-type domain-containing protein n=1 Tax=Guillardia theta (strain CCMP2712) TaxID=905079 RepID=L1I6I5_GUITC|nr:hypothetical protein GUITHDRAFT_121971 [Guillardia theta CCMP2712]EKX31836.1 hypothetical protein GUITHDRAFT_121971 [Guillardia theta CCMP2712]|eukprot:XP_005818816.1 hypothetical protein GUITHDRAFT_121971 [Guillardia theta CCMP2712]